MPGVVFKTDIEREAGYSLIDPLERNSKNQFEKIPCGAEVVTNLLLIEDKTIPKSSQSSKQEEIRKSKMKFAIDFKELIFLGGTQKGNLYF